MDEIFSTCSKLKASLTEAIASELEVSQVHGVCVVTMPFKTADHRNIDVFVEPMRDSKTFMYVHDGGKNTAELYAQGIHGTERTETVMKGIARAHGATYQQGRFQVLCKDEAQVLQAILAINQCATLAMLDVVMHTPTIESELLATKVARVLSQWRPDEVEIHRRYQARGKTGVDHSFDFVARPLSSSGRKTVAIKLLPPSVGPSWQVSRYGFLTLDIRPPESRWPRLAIVSRVEEWTSKALDVVRELSTDVILLETDHEDRVERLLPAKLDDLTEAA